MSSKPKLIFDIILFQLFIFFSIKTIQSCPKDYPILKDGQCILEFCTKEQFNSGECQINNEIIQTQWLNNFINLEISYLRYVNFASCYNGDMILQSNTYPITKTRIFLGFKKNGRGFFLDKQTNKSSYYYYL